MKGIEITVNQFGEKVSADLLQPILRDTSPNALRREQMEKDFNESIVGINIRPDFTK